MPTHSLRTPCTGAGLLADSLARIGKPEAPARCAVNIAMSEAVVPTHLSTYAFMRNDCVLLAVLL